MAPDCSGAHCSRKVESKTELRVPALCKHVGEENAAVLSKLASISFTFEKGVNLTACQRLDAAYRNFQS